jgi:hypothetical protein
MNIFVLSQLTPSNQHIGLSVLYDLEAALTETCNPTFIYPEQNDKIKILKRYRHRIFQSWFKVKDLPSLGNGPNILFVMGMGPRFLLSMPALGKLLKQFDLRIAYLADGFDPKHIDRDVVHLLDGLMLPIAEMVDEVNGLVPAKSAFIPLATDALNWASYHADRPIDIMSYGRTRQEVHRCLQRVYGAPESDRIYFHTTSSSPEVFSPKEHRALLWKMLTRSKVNLCFEASNLPRFRGYSPILLRWFEGFAAGCTIVGNRPFGKGVKELIDWENSTIELPKNPLEWHSFMEGILSDSSFLRENSIRNYRECLARHDWRYRIRDMFQMFDLPVPDTLTQSLSQLNRKVQEVSEHQVFDLSLAS